MINGVTQSELLRLLDVIKVSYWDINGVLAFIEWAMNNL